MLFNNGMVSPDMILDGKKLEKVEATHLLLRN